MDATAPAGGHVARSTTRTVGIWALRLGLLAGSLVALRFSVVLNLEEMRRASAEVDLLGAFTSAKGLSALILAIATGFLFTMACRVPLGAGLRWTPIALAVLPLSLLAHAPLVLAREAPVSGWFSHFFYLYFFDRQDARWVLAVLVGVAFGVAVGRTPARPGVGEPAGS